MYRLLLLSFAISAPSQAAQAENRMAARPDIIQISVDPANPLQITLLDAVGRKRPGIQVLVQNKSQSFRLTTDASGRAQTSQLSPGLWMLTVGDRSVICQIWRKELAPPGAREELLLIDASSEIVRGNNKPRRRHRPARMSRSTRKYGMAILALGGTATYFALSRDNAS